MPALKKVIGRAFPLLQDYVRLRRGYRGNFGTSPNIFRPKTFSEKIQHRKLFDHDLRLPLRADKIEVKQFVSDRLGRGWVTPTLWHGTQLPDRPAWPVPFVLKASHGSAMNMFVRSEPDWNEIRVRSRKWLAERYYGSWGGEWLYSQIQPRLLAEPFIGELFALPVDYKLWTFNGRVEFIQVDTDREIGHKRTMFDRDWKRMPFTIGFPADQRDIQKPSSLKEMIEAAQTLSENIAFVRVDLYEIDKTPRFGEMTFYPGCGWEKFAPPEFDRIVGDLWR
jgi:hypothetical protein